MPDRFLIRLFCFPAMIFENPQNILLINLCLSALLCGLIWTIQVVHYPSFLDVGADEYVSFQQNHMRNISLVVIPLMLLELAAGIYLQIKYASFNLHWSVFLATFLLVFIWIITMFFASPLHGKLVSQGFNIQNIRRLIHINWWRTIAWTAKTVILFLLLLK